MSRISPRYATTLRRIAAFRDDEDGGYMVWSLLWFLVYCGIGGLAVDVTDAYRNQALLQSTADAAALAGAMSLPDASSASTEALLFSADNMSPGINGDVLKGSDISVGTWDTAARTFTPGGIAPNAVRVVTQRSDANTNPVDMTVLGVISLFGMAPRWNIATEAIAIRYVPACANEGFIARNKVDISSGNDLLNRICLHGQTAGVDVQNHDYFEPGVTVSMPDLDMLPDRASIFAQNPGLADALSEGDLWPKDVDLLNQYVSQLQSLNTGFNPSWAFMYRPNGTGGYIMPTKVTGKSLPAILEPYTVYDIDCNGQQKLPTNVLVEKVVIVATCRLQASADVSAGNVVIASTYSGGGAAIDMAAKSNLGLADNCAPGGGVELYTPGNVHVSAQGIWNGLRVVAGNDVKFTANNSDIRGISVQAGHEFDFTSNNQFGFCVGNNPGPRAWHYRLVL